MSTGPIGAIVVAIVVAAAVIMLMAAARRRRLQQRFGPEYDRLVGERDSKRKAAAELSERERRVRRLGIRPLTPAARANYADRWAGIQQRFVDEPPEAVAATQVLVIAVMSERGYPAERYDQVVADLSVEHAKTLDSYRAAEKISASAAAGTASTEDLRQAMIHYRALFRELIGEPANAVSGSAAGMTQDRIAGDAPAGEPVVAGPVVPGPDVADPVVAGPVVAGPVVAGPVVAGPEVAEPMRSIPADEPVDNRQSGIQMQRTPRS